MKIASLLPAATEIACALGAGQQLVARSHECDHPAEVAGIPVVTRTRLTGLGGSAEIDRDLRELLAHALSIYELDVDALSRAAPDVILTQDLCDVCALPYELVRKAAAQLLPRAQLVRLSPLCLTDVWQDFQRVGAALGRAREAAALVASSHSRLRDLRTRASAAARVPQVLTIEWLAPVMIGATWMPELVELAGGHALVGVRGAKAPTLGLPELAALRPDVVLVKPCGFSLERARAESALLAELLRGLDWPALREGNVWLADGNAYFNRPGPRLVDSAELLAGCLHPRLFPELRERYAASSERWTPG